MKNSQYVNRQTAFEYVIYMIVGSYFEEARCKDPVRERGMHFHYRELSEREQLKMEDKCIRYTERFLAELPKGIWKEKVQVRFLKNTGSCTMHARSAPAPRARGISVPASRYRITAPDSSCRILHRGRQSGPVLFP